MSLDMLAAMVLASITMMQEMVLVMSKAVVTGLTHINRPLLPFLADDPFSPTLLLMKHFSQ